MHGARGGARPGKAHPNYVRGGRSQETVMLRALVNELAREAREAALILEGDDG